jgi:hypothetical protein
MNASFRPRLLSLALVFCVGSAAFFAFTVLREKGREPGREVTRQREVRDSGQATIDSMSETEAAGRDPANTGAFGEQRRRISAIANPLRRQLAMLQAIESLSAAEIRDALSDELPYMEEFPGATTRLLFSRWAELAPREAAEAYLERIRLSGNGDITDGAISTWASFDPAAAQAWVEALEPSPERECAVAQLMSGLSRKDPEAAFRLLVKNPALRDSNLYHIQGIMAHWAERDPAAAAAAAEEAVKTMAPNIAERACNHVAMAWARKDPDAAIAWARTLSNDRMRMTAVAMACHAWILVDPATGLAKIQAMDNAADRDAALTVALRNMAKSNPAQALALSESISAGRMRDEAMATAIKSLAAADLQAAMAATEKMAASNERDTALRALIDRLRTSDPAAALDLAMKRSNTEGRLVGSLVAGWMRSAPEAALSWVATHQVKQQEQWEISNSIAEWAALHPDEAVAKLTQPQAGDGSKLLFDGVVQGLAKSDPQRAADLVLTSASASYQMVAEVAVRLADTDPVKAGSWVQRLPENSPARPAASSRVARSWAQKDPRAAVAWVESLPVGNLREGAAWGLASRFAETQPEAAIQWLGRISDPAMRPQATNEVLGIWLRRDRDAAQAWIRENAAFVGEPVIRRLGLQP